MIILTFRVKYLKNLRELDDRLIACNFLVFGIFLFFSDFFRSNWFTFEPKVEKNYIGVFSTHFVPLISGLAPKIMEDWNSQLYKLWFLQILTFVTELNQIPGTFLWSFPFTFGLAYSPLNSAKLSCSSEVTLLFKNKDW